MVIVTPLTGFSRGASDLLYILVPGTRSASSVSGYHCPPPPLATSYCCYLGVFFFFFNWNLFLICLHWVLAAALGSLLFIAACRLFSCRRWTLGCGIWALVPWPGMEPGPPALGVWSPSHWASGQVPVVTCWCGYGGGHEATGNDCGSLSSVPSPPGYWNRMCVAWLSWVIQNSN